MLLWRCLRCCGVGGVGVVETSSSGYCYGGCFGKLVMSLKEEKARVHARKGWLRRTLDGGKRKE